MNRRLKTRLFVYPIIVVGAFAYSLLHSKIVLNSSPDTMGYSAPQVSALPANLHAEPGLALKAMASLGLVQAQLSVTKFYIDNDEFEKAQPFAEKIYTSGNAAAINNVGTYYDYKKHYQEALRFYQKAISTETIPLAMSNLGTLYAQGAGVTKDTNKAQQLFKTAADAGDALGQYDLGVIYAQQMHTDAAKHYLNLALSNSNAAQKPNAEKALAALNQAEENSQASAPAASLAKN